MILSTGRLKCLLAVDSVFVFFRDEDSEKLEKSEDDSAVSVSTQLPPTVPHVPITTPPPPVMGTDMSAQAGYGGYGNWYQVKMI